MSENPLTFEAKSEGATLEFGRALAAVLFPGAVVALSGTLGAGKTRLVQAVAEALGVDRREVVSPTFVLVQEYHGRLAIYHMDVYRLRDEEEFIALGAEEYFAGEGIVFVEWADRVSNCLPRERLEIHIDVTGDESRAFQVVGRGQPYQGCANELARRLGPTSASF